jgi:DNA (cytosine-5)-methyltransferase 1
MHPDQSQLSAVSLFTSGGIGDLALRASGFDILVSNELLDDRHSLFAANFPSTTAVTGDLWTNADLVVRFAADRLRGAPLSLLYATPPCQGMSKNGRGKLLNAIRAGRKPALDDRNRLIIPTLRVAKRLNPEIVLFENVPEMEHTIVLDEHGEAVGILDLIRRELGADYDGAAEVVEFADYGVPQCRQRLISIFSRNDRLKSWLQEHGTLLPPATHSKRGLNNTLPWVTVRDAIADCPPLDARNVASATSSIPFHSVPLLDTDKYWWVSNTKQNSSAFDNQCVSCGFDRNPTHAASHDCNGINRTSADTPLYCVKCGELLPRPSVELNGVKRLMRGFTSAYKRMSYDKPASALTRNLSYACSDNKLHPTQHRVLSLYEAFRIHTIDHYEYKWIRADRRKVSDKIVREVIGESIPPLGLQRITDHLAQIYLGTLTVMRYSGAGPLFEICGVPIK